MHESVSERGEEGRKRGGRGTERQTEYDSSRIIAMVIIRGDLQLLLINK